MKRKAKFFSKTEYVSLEVLLFIHLTLEYIETTLINNRVFSFSFKIPVLMITKLCLVEKICKKIIYLFTVF